MIAKDLKKNKTVQLFLLIALFFLITAPHVLSKNKPVELNFSNEKLDSIRVMIESSRQFWSAPAVSVAIVKDNHIVFADGFGLRDIGRNLKADAHTLYSIGSCTKSFTATLAGIAVDRGLLEWDRPVIEYFPDFQMYDYYTTININMIDMLAHRTGLPRHELSWYGSTKSRAELVEAVRYLNPNLPFRSEYQYQNAMYTTAGYLLGQLNNTTWETLLKREILDPLEMRETTGSSEELINSDNHALSYQVDTETQNQSIIKPINIDASAPAAGVISNAIDLSTWLSVNLNNGAHNNKRIISNASLSKIHSSHIAINKKLANPEITENNYALGWQSNDYRGNRMLYHDGELNGYSSAMALLPDQKLGLVILSNQAETYLVEELTYNLIDLILGLELIDWQNKYEETAFAEKIAYDNKFRYDRVENTKLSHHKSSYAGMYEHPAYGFIHIIEKNGRFTGMHNSRQLSLKHWHYDIFLTSYKDNKNNEFLMAFGMNGEGAIDRIMAPLEPELPEIVFHKMIPDSLFRISYLRKFTGDYFYSDQFIKVSVTEDSLLSVTVPGRPQYKLTPYSINKFRIENSRETLIRFETVEDKVQVIIIKQNNGNFTARKIKR